MDRHVAPVAHTVGVTVLGRLVEEVRVRFDPEDAKARALAAAEAAVGLGIILAFYRNKETINIDEMNLMRW